MTNQPAALARLMQSLRCLPGVGPKSAQRMAYHLIERDRAGARQLADDVEAALEQVVHCRRCRALSDSDLCGVCVDAGRDPGLLCVVETPADLLVIEQATGYRGLYFVLLGRLSPLDGIGPGELALDLLHTRLQREPIRELILATNPTVEGEATAHYVGEMARACGIKASRIAHGVPLGGELEFVDSGTLSHAFTGRREV